MKAPGPPPGLAQPPWQRLRAASARVKWAAGAKVEVAWTILANHGGGCARAALYALPENAEIAQIHLVGIAHARSPVRPAKRAYVV